MRAAEALCWPPDWPCDELGHLYEISSRMVCAQCGHERDVEPPADAWAPAASGVGHADLEDSA